ncbi:MAG: glucosaminidase domain-containing protein [Chitinophagaceae bacterium]
MLRQFRICLLMLMLCTTASVRMSAQARSGAEYVERFRPTAVLLMEKTGIPASVILGISMVESAMGTSKIARLLNNYFGVKGKNHAKFRSAYKQYETAEHSFKDFVRIVHTKKYYHLLKGTKDYKKWLKAMNAHGYAEAKGKWIKDVSHMITRYHLDEIDKEDYVIDDDGDYLWGVDSTLLKFQE